MRFRAAVIMSLAILMAASQSAFGAYLIFGAGTVRCGEWTRLRTLRNDVASLYQLQAWVDGYVSGVNVARGEDGEPDFLASKPQGSALYAVIDNHCNVNPLDSVAEATLGLVRQLRERAAAVR
jgi:hypothetical protein